jgi:hypothetical protein
MAAAEPAVPRVSREGRRIILDHLAAYRDLVRLVIDGERELAAGDDCFNSGQRSLEAVQHGVGDPVSLIVARRAALRARVEAAAWWVRAIDDVMSQVSEEERAFVVACWIDRVESYGSYEARMGWSERQGKEMRRRLLDLIGLRAGVR